MNQEELLSKIFGMITRGVADRKSPLHTPAIATIGLDGSPQSRIVVLRKFFSDERVLLFHTDLRSPKILELEYDKRISWLFYHSSEKLQFRILGRITIHSQPDDPLKLKQWQGTWNFGRRCYMGAAPSQISENPTSGMPEEIVEREPTTSESEVGFANFAVISTKISQIDCLELNVKGHQRSLFTWDENDNLTMQWLTP